MGRVFAVVAMVVLSGCVIDDGADLEPMPAVVDSTGVVHPVEDDAPPWAVEGVDAPAGIDWAQPDDRRTQTHFGDLCGEKNGDPNANYGSCGWWMFCGNGYPNASTSSAEGLCISCVRPPGYTYAGYADAYGWCSSHYDGLGISYVGRTGGVCPGGPYCDECRPADPNGHDPGPDGICNNGDPLP